MQQRREMPVRRIQAGQVFIHRRMFGPGGKPFPFSWPARKLIGLLAPLLRRVAPGWWDSGSARSTCGRRKLSQRGATMAGCFLPG